MAMHASMRRGAARAAAWASRSRSARGARARTHAPEGIEGAADPPIDAKSSIVLRWVVLVRYLLGLDPLTASSTSDPPDPAASSSLATTVVRGIA